MRHRMAKPGIVVVGAPELFRRVSPWRLSRRPRGVGNHSASRVRTAPNRIRPGRRGRGGGLTVPCARAASGNSARSDRPTTACRRRDKLFTKAASWSSDPFGWLCCCAIKVSRGSSGRDMLVEGGRSWGAGTACARLTCLGLLCLRNEAASVRQQTLPAAVISRARCQERLDRVLLGHGDCH